MPYHLAMAPDDSDGNRTRVTAVKGRCLNRLTTEPYIFVFPQNRIQLFALLSVVSYSYMQLQVSSSDISSKCFCRLSSEPQSLFILLYLFPVPSRISPRPISDIQLSASLHLHPCPIYLIVSKGSYILIEWDISS